MSRRRFLKAGLLAGGTLLGAGGVGLVALRGRAPTVDGLWILDAHAHQTLASLVAVMFPRCEEMPVDVEGLGLPRLFDGFLADEPAHNVDDLTSALLLIEFGPLIYERRFTTFSRLSPAGRLAYWESWGLSDDLLRRQVSVAMRKFFHLVFFDQPEVWPHIGYPGPSLSAPPGELP